MRTLFTAALLAVAPFTAGVAGQQLVTLPPGSWANDITPDGEVVVGTYSGGGFIWRWRTEPSPTVVPGGDMVAVSDDGTVVCGNMPDPVSGAEVAGRWTASTGWEPLGSLLGDDGCGSLSHAYDISGDGSTIVGLAWNGCSGRGFRWTEATGMQELMNLVNGNNRASAISGDGSLIGGFAQGDFDRTPAYWTPDTVGLTVDSSLVGEVHGISHDGATSVGGVKFPGVGEQRAFIRDTATGQTQNLGNLNGGFWKGIATDLSHDGQVVVGYDTIGLGREAWVWTPADGIVGLDTILADAGLGGGFPTWVCRAVSGDGTVVVGGGEGDGSVFGFGAFIAELPDLVDDPWTDLGGGTAGANGVPTLVGSGSLVGGTAVGLSLSGAPRDALMVAWLAFDSQPFAALGGTVHAAPFAQQFVFRADGGGNFAAGTTWPTGLPAGTEAWFQFVVEDPSVIWGLTLSNGLKATTP